jgi:hypothetical protein
MSMMSNFPARFSFRWLLCTAILAVALTSTEQGWAADTPAPATRSIAPLQQGTTTTVRTAQRVKINEVSVRPLQADDPAVSRLLPESARAALKSPVMVTVQVAEPFANLERNASPVIVINGETVSDSIVPFNERNRVVAIVPDSTRLDETVRVQVGWLGDFQRTLSDPVLAHVAR